MESRQDPLAPEYQAWVRALKRREPGAWVQLQQQALDAVFGFAYLRCGRREDAEDVTADTFAAAVAAIEGYRGGARIETWLIGIARRKLVDRARRRGSRPEVLETELPAAAEPISHAPGETPQEALERRDRAAKARACIRELPALQREAFRLFCIDQLSLAETAQVLGRNENAVKALIHRARVTLRERLAESDAPAAVQETNHVEATLSAAVPVGK